MTEVDRHSFNVSDDDMSSVFMIVVNCTNFGKSV